MRAVFRFIYIVVTAFAAVFALLALSGLFLPVAPGVTAVIYSLPLYICSFVLLLAVIADVLLIPGGRVVLRWTLLLSLTFLTAGYWVGGLMSYSLEAVITEGQTVMTREEPAVFRANYIGKYARIPEVSVTLRELRPEFSSEGNSIESLTGSFMVSDKGDTASEVKLRPGKGYSDRGYMLDMEGFGYSPRYELKNKEGKVLDSSFVYLRIFPPGSEDFFRLLSPLTYYLRYYPQGEHGAYFRVRVARNKDLTFNGDVSLGEEFSYDNAAMSFPELREWTILTIKGNPGRPLLALGLLALFLALAWEWRQRFWGLGRLSKS